MQFVGTQEAVGRKQKTGNSLRGGPSGRPSRFPSMRDGIQITVLTATVLASGAMAKASLKAGDAAPDFALADQSGATVRLADFRGKKSVVLAFYIRAGTPG